MRNLLKVWQILKIKYIYLKMIINSKQRPNVTTINESKSMLDFYVHQDAIFKLTQKYQPQRLHEVLSKYSKRSRSAG